MIAPSDPHSLRTILRSLQTNNISNSLLCYLLLPLLQKTRSINDGFIPHLTIVASDVHFDVASFPCMEEGDKDGKILKTLSDGDVKQRYQESKGRS